MSLLWQSIYKVIEGIIHQRPRVALFFWFIFTEFIELQKYMEMDRTFCVKNWQYCNTLTCQVLWQDPDNSTPVDLELLVYSIGTLKADWTHFHLVISRTWVNFISANVSGVFWGWWGGESNGFKLVIKWTKTQCFLWRICVFLNMRYELPVKM